jgi:hypothetical protein
VDSSESVQNLQHKLLVELLKLNVENATNSCALRLPPINSRKNQTTSMSEIVCHIDHLVSSLQSISSQLKTANMERKKDFSLTFHQMREFIDFTGSLRKSILSLSDPFETSPLTQVKEKVVSLVRYLDFDKKRIESLNCEYVNELGELRAKSFVRKELVKSALEAIYVAKETVASIMNTYLSVEDHHFNTVKILLNSFQINIQSLSQNTSNSSESFRNIEDAIQRIYRMMTNFSNFMEMRNLETSNLRIEKALLEKRFKESQKELFELQKKHKLEIEMYKQQIANIQTELAPTEDQKTPPSSVTRKRRVLVETVIAFTGVSRDLDLLKELTCLASEKLNCKVHISAEFTSEITHVVCPQEYQSVRTMAAALSSKWIISTDWLVQSAKVGHLLPEVKYGQLYADGPMTLRGKTFRMTPAFISQQSTHQMNASCCRTLIEPIGKGHLVDNIDDNDYVLCGDHEVKRDRRWIRVKEFIRMIPGHK